MPILIVMNKIDLIKLTNGYENHYSSSESDDEEFFDSKRITEEDEIKIIDDIIYNRVCSQCISL